MSESKAQLRNLTFNETFQSSLMQNSDEKFSLDKSLIRGIKNKDISMIIDQNQVSGGPDEGELYDEVGELAQIMVGTRKMYDRSKTNSNQLEKSIELLRKQKEVVQLEADKLNEQFRKQKEALQQVSQKFREVSDLMENTQFKKDIYNNIKDTVKHDLLVIKKRLFDKDVQFMRESTKLKSLRIEYQNKINLSKRCREMVESVQKSVYSQNMERRSKIKSFHEVVSRKQSNAVNREIRERQIEEVMLLAMYDKQAEQKQWLKIFMANMFLKGILKSKMEKLMRQYHQIQLSFHKIKQATSVRESNQLVDKYMSREESYGFLLNSIAQKQRKLEQVKQEKQILQKKNQHLMHIHDEIADQDRKLNLNTNKKDPHSQIQQLNQKILQISRKQQLMYQWGIKFLINFTDSPNREQILQKYSKQNKKELIIDILKRVSEYVDKQQKSKTYSLTIQSAFLQSQPKERILSARTMQKNNRIKTISTRQNQNAEETIEDKDVAYDDLSEADYIQHHRRAIKKNEQQFRRFRVKTKPN